MDKRTALKALEEILNQAEEAGAHPGNATWQPKIDRAWRRALDAGIKCHIHSTIGEGRWILITDVTTTPELDPQN